MRKLVVCCDGTWNDATQKGSNKLKTTNVARFHNLLDQTQANQLSFYQPGVGTGGFLDRHIGGMYGRGLGKQIMACYQWLVSEYQPGDVIYLIGFSRGAFCARSLAGLINRYGILVNHFPSAKALAKAVNVLYREGYQYSLEDRQLPTPMPVHPDSKTVGFVGVWDTVGALGIPDDLVIFDLFDAPRRYRFHDVELSREVLNGRHALAIDEQRSSFFPTLWSNEQHPSVKQVWFAGAHADVGGGYEERGCADISLEWMIEEVRNPHLNGDVPALSFIDNFANSFAPNPEAPIHDTYQGIMRFLLPHPRSVPNLADEASIHHSVRQRQQADLHPTYRPECGPCTDGASLTISANEAWNWTGVYVEAGKHYQIQCADEWVDAPLEVASNGIRLPQMRLRVLLQLSGSVIDHIEWAVKRIINKHRTDLFLYRRIPKEPWFCVMAAIADAPNPSHDGTPPHHRVLRVGKSLTWTAATSGYLYLFANDAWAHYGHNSGTLEVTVQQLTASNGADV